LVGLSSDCSDTLEKKLVLIKGKKKEKDFLEKDYS
jgi:hypothetical protein